MAKIGLSEGFSLIPEGTHVFQIVKVNYKEDFGKMEVTMQLATGQKHVERNRPIIPQLVKQPSSCYHVMRSLKNS